MSLNEEAINDLDDTLVDEDIIKTPESATTDHVSIVVKSDDVKDEVTQLSQDDLNNIINANVQFKVVEDNIAKVVDLREIEDQIIAKESIDKDTSRLVDQYFNGLFDKVSVEEFTVLPSKTNYVLCLKHMQQVIAQEQDNITNEYATCVTKSLIDNRTVISTIKDSYLHKFLSQYTQIKNLANEALTFISDNKNKVVPYTSQESTEFVDITILDIDVLDFTKLPETFATEQLSSFLLNIRSILADHTFRTLLHIAINNDTIVYPFDNKHVLDYSTKPVTIMDILVFLNSPVLQNYLESIECVLNTSIEFIDQVEADLPKLINFNEVKNYVTKYNQDIIRTNDCFVFIYKTMLNMQSLSHNFNELVNFLFKL